MRIHERKHAAGTRGATIVEFLIYLAVVAVVLTSTVLFAVEALAAQAKAAAYSEAVRNGRYAIERFAVEAREATGINAGASTFGSHPGVVSLAKANPSLDPTIFSVAAGALQVQQGAGPAVPITSSKVEVSEFIVDDVSTAGRTRALHVRLKVRTKDPSAWQQVAAEAVFETTVRVHPKDGFSN